MLVNQCPFGGCSGETNGTNGNKVGQPPVVIYNNGGSGQCQCCDNKQQQPIIINNIIPADVLKAAGAVKLTPEQAATITPVETQTPSTPTPVQPIVNVHLPPQAAPQVNLSMPDIQIPPINVNIPPQGASQGGSVNPTSSPTYSAPPNSGTGSTSPSSPPSSPQSSLPSSSPSGATSSVQPSGASSESTPTAGNEPATSTPDVEKVDTAQILKEIEALKSQLMPFYDANTKPGATPSLPDGNSPTTSGTGYGSSGCCIPNIHVNVSPRFNQQLLASARDAAPTRYGYTTESSGSSGQQARQTTGETAQQPSQPPTDVNRTAQNQGMQPATTQRTNSTCNECEEDDDDIEFYINDKKRVKPKQALSNRFQALPKAPLQEFA